MDSITHIVLGACIGEAIAGRQLGKKALLLGAIAQSIPDIDFVASFWLPTASDLIAHRGFTHSFLFLLLFAPPLAYMSAYFLKRLAVPVNRWLIFWALQIFIHLFIDAFNAYGIGWFELFSHYRVSFNTMYVVDPVFTIWPAAAACALLILKTGSAQRKFWTRTALCLSSLYLVLGIFFKLYVTSTVKNDLQSRHISYTHLLTTPTPLNNLLWFVVAENDSGYYCGYRSVCDRQSKTDLHYNYRNDALLEPYKNRDDVAQLLRFADGYYTVELWHDTLVFNTLRFGEMLGWAQPHPRFACYYFVQYPDNNKLIIQRGRFAGWNNEMFSSFVARIKGI